MTSVTHDLPPQLPPQLPLEPPEQLRVLLLTGAGRELLVPA